MTKDQGDLKSKARSYLAEGWPEKLQQDYVRYKQTRTKRAEKIRTLLHEVGALPQADGVLLDVGCSSGLMLELMAKDAKYCVGIELDGSAGLKPHDNIGFAIADGEDLPFADSSINVIVCNHIYEHTSNPSKLMDEIWRVLKPGGHCYFAGPSRWDLIEPHYRLPFLSWLPRPLANGYMRITGKGHRYMERPLPPKEVALLLKRFDVSPCIEKIVQDPLKYGSEDLIPPGSLRQTLAIWLAKHIPSLFPGYVFLCRKP